MTNTLPIMKLKKKIVVLTGAGMSVESGLTTFRDAGGLWPTRSCASPIATKSPRECSWPP